MGGSVMNTVCEKRCAYKDICNLDKQNTSECKVWCDYPAQTFKYATIMGYKTEDLLRRQYKDR